MRVLQQQTQMLYTSPTGLVGSCNHSQLLFTLLSVSVAHIQWHNILTGGPWTNHIKGPIPHFEFTE